MTGEPKRKRENVVGAVLLGGGKANRTNEKSVKKKKKNFNRNVSSDVASIQRKKKAMPHSVTEFFFFYSLAIQII